MIGCEARYYTIRVRGALSADWSEWFEGLFLTQEASGETVLAGWLRDQAALYGVLLRLNALNLPLLAVSSEAAHAADGVSHSSP